MKLEQLECLRSEDTPYHLMNTVLLSHIGSQDNGNKVKATNLKICQNLKVLNVETNVTCDTSSEVAW